MTVHFDRLGFETGNLLFLNDRIVEPLDRCTVEFLGFDAFFEFDGIINLGYQDVAVLAFRGFGCGCLALLGG